MAKEEKKKTKRPTAQKRDIRNLKRRMINKAFKSQARTTLRNFEEALKAGDKQVAQERLNNVYSMVDKATKRGLFKQNKANRIKARFSQKLSVTA